jgi:hypothetical protein
MPGTWDEPACTRTVAQPVNLDLWQIEVGRQAFLETCERRISAAEATLRARLAQAMYAPNYALQAVEADRLAITEQAAQAVRHRDLEIKLTELVQQAPLREMIYKPKMGRPRPRLVRVIAAHSVLQAAGLDTGRAEQWLRRHGWTPSMNTNQWMKGEPYVGVP